MPDFVNPFPGIVPVDRPMTSRELTRALRLSLSAEEEAVHLYEAIADATDNELAKRVLQNIANEERVHIGEFQEVLNTLAPDEQDFLDKGAEEVRQGDAGQQAPVQVVNLDNIDDLLKQLELG